MPSHLDNSVARIPEDIDQTIPLWHLEDDPLSSLDSHRVSDDDLHHSMTIEEAEGLSDADCRHDFQHYQCRCAIFVANASPTSSNFIIFVASLTALIITTLLSLFTDR